jgi:cation diffusion facilitator family transporter
MASGTSSQVMTVDNLEDTAIALPTPEMYPRPPAYNNGSGVFRNSWRLNPESFETQKKTEAQIQGLHRRLPRHFNTGAKDGIVDFYRRQNQLVENFQEIEQLIRRTDPSMNTPSDTALHENNNKSEQRRARRESFALRISFYANACLLIIKVFAAYSSGSLSIITSALDSFLDLVSGLILWATDQSMRKQDKYLYPAGKSRMQPLGIIVFSCIMGTLGFQVLIEGVRQLVGPDHTHHLEDLYGLIAIMVSVIIVKFCLWLYCRRSNSAAVQTYAQDHRNDVATNSVGLASAMLGDRLVFWIDPFGAILLATYIIYNWTDTAIGQIKAMVGVSAPPEFLTQLTYLAWNHHPEIVCIDTVRAYTFGPKFFVEVDVVLPEETELRSAHDIGESLQDRIEEMEDVERAFVHLDFETSHFPEHAGNMRSIEKFKRMAAMMAETPLRQRAKNVSAGGKDRFI